MAGGLDAGHEGRAAAGLFSAAGLGGDAAELLGLPLDRVLHAALLHWGDQG